jgi:hypothetical protein
VILDLRSVDFHWHDFLLPLGVLIPCNSVGNATQGLLFSKVYLRGRMPMMSLCSLAPCVLQFSL